MSEVVVLDTDSWAAREREADRPKAQRRGSVKKKLTDTLENVVKRSPSLHSLKRFSGPPRLGSPTPSPGLPQSSSQQHGHGRSHSCSRSRPTTPHTPSYQTHPTSSPLVNTNWSNLHILRAHTRHLCCASARQLPRSAFRQTFCVQRH